MDEIGHMVAQRKRHADLACGVPLECTIVDDGITSPVGIGEQVGSKRTAIRRCGNTTAVPAADQRAEGHELSGEIREGIQSICR